MATVLEERNATEPEAGTAPATIDRLAVIVPVYNEDRTVAELLRRLEAQPCVSQIIIVDDGSTDRTWEELEPWRARATFTHKHGEDTQSIIVLQHDKNRGKGRAIRTGLDHVTCSHVIIQDADLEYDPADINKLWAVMQSGKADVLFGSRYLENPNLQKGRFVLQSGVRCLNVLVRLLFGLRLTDEASCFKMFRTEHMMRMHLRCERFEFCPEVTGKAAIMKLRMEEVAVGYSPRSVDQGKKIRFRDAVEAAIALIRIRFGLWEMLETGARPQSHLTELRQFPAMFSSIALIAAAALKMQVAIDSRAIWTGNAFLAVVEAAIAFTLMSGISLAATNLVTILVFIIFSLYSFKLAVSGADVCGCFGAVRLSPWFAVAIDLFVLTTWLVLFGANRVQLPRSLRTVWSLLLVVVAAGAITLGTMTVQVAAEVVTGRELTVLQPRTWLGERCPILGSANIGSELAVGEWIVILHHTGCSACQQLHDEYAGVGVKLPLANTPSTRVAFLEVGYPESRLSGPDRQSSSLYSIGWLNPEIDWVAPTPCVFRLSDGTVTDVQEHAGLGSSVRFRRSN